MRKLFVSMAAIALLTAGIAAQAGVLTFNLSEVGGNIVATASGTLNTNALNRDGQSQNNGCLMPSLGLLIVGNQTSVTTNVWTGFQNPAKNFGSGGFVTGNTGSGDSVAVNLNSSLVCTPWNYVSGSVLYGTSTWTGNTFAKLGIKSGTYTMNYNAGADSVVLNVGAPAVPEPSSILALMIGGVGLTGLVARRRRS